jgi:hypothetical protein
MRFRGIYCLNNKGLRVVTGFGYFSCVAFLSSPQPVTGCFTKYEGQYLACGISGRDRTYLACCRQFNGSFLKLGQNVGLLVGAAFWGVEADIWERKFVFI